MGSNELLHLYSIIYETEYTNITKALKEVAEEDVSTSYVCMKNERSFHHLPVKNSLSLYFIYIPTVETFMRFSKEFLAHDNYLPLHFIVICSSLSKELMLLSYKYKIRTLAFIDSAKSKQTCKQEIRECIDYVKVIQQQVDKKEGLR